MKSEKAEWIHDYFLATERIVQEYSKQIFERKLKYERAAGKEQAILNQFQNGESINYIRTIPDEAIIDGIALNEDEKLGKFDETFKSGKGGRNKDHKTKLVRIVLSFSPLKVQMQSYWKVDSRKSSGSKNVWFQQLLMEKIKKNSSCLTKSFQWIVELNCTRN